MLGRYNAWAESFNTVRGGGKVRLGFEGDQTRSFRFAVALERPDQLRLQGRLGPTAAVFDLGSVNDAWTLYLPQERRVVRALAGEPAGPLGTPGDFLLALMPEPVLSGALQEGAAGREGGQYRLVIPPGYGSPFHRVLMVAPDTGLPSRIILRRETQLEEPVLTVVFSGFEDHDGVWFPRIVHITAEDIWASMEFTSVRLNETLDPRRFKVRVPYGVEEMELDDLGADFLPAEESQ